MSSARSSVGGASASPLEQLALVALREQAASSAQQATTELTKTSSGSSLGGQSTASTSSDSQAPTLSPTPTLPPYSPSTPWRGEGHFQSTRSVSLSGGIIERVQDRKCEVCSTAVPSKMEICQGCWFKKWDAAAKLGSIQRRAERPEASDDRSAKRIATEGVPAHQLRN